MSRREDPYSAEYDSDYSAQTEPRHDGVEINGRIASPAEIRELLDRLNAKEKENQEKNKETK